LTGPQDPAQAMQMLQNPMVQQMMQQMLSDPQALEQVSIVVYVVKLIVLLLFCSSFFVCFSFFSWELYVMIVLRISYLQLIAYSSHLTFTFFFPINIST